MRKIGYALEALLLNTALLSLKIFPLPLLRYILRLKLKLLLSLPFLKNQIGVVKVNLKCMFAGEGKRKSEGDLIRLAKENLLRWGDFFLLFLASFQMGLRLFRKKMDVHGEAEIEKALASGRDILLVSSHYSNFLFSLYYLSWVKKLPCILSLRRIDNPFIFKKLKKKLRKKNIECLIRKGFIKAFLKREKEKKKMDLSPKVFFLLADQNTLIGERFVSFFGLPAGVARTAWYLQEKTGCAVIYTYVQEEKKKVVFWNSFPSYSLHYSEPLDKKAGEKAFLSAISEMLEQCIRKDFIQYLWAHPKWKKRPKTEVVEKNPYLGLRV